MRATVADGGHLRFGLVGTGYWATQTHAPGIKATSGARLAAIWGRNHTAAYNLATTYGSLAYDDFDDFLEQVDAVSFSVPPDVQAPLAVRAASAASTSCSKNPLLSTRPQATTSPRQWRPAAS